MGTLSAWLYDEKRRSKSAFADVFDTKKKN